MSTSVTYNGTVYPIPAAGELNWSALSAFLIDVGTTAGLNTTRKQAIRKCTTTPVTVSATTDYAIVTDLASPGAVAVNLPAGVAGLTFAIVDGKGDALTNNITINRNGSDTIAGATTLVLNQNRQAVALQYNLSDTDWKIIYNAGGTSGSGGSGEKNYLSASTSSATGWTASGAGITVANDTTAAELPRPNTTGTGFKVTGVSGSTAYAYARFILDDADANKKLKLQFDMKPVSGYAASDFKVDVYSNTASDYTTGNTRMALSTDSSAISALPLLTGTYRTTFDAPAVSAKYIEVRIGLNGTNTHACVFSDLIVGPGVVQQGAAATPWTAYTPTLTWVSNTTGTAVYRRVGETIEVRAHIALSGAPTSAALSIALPSGLTFSSAATPSGGPPSSGYGAAGTWQGYDASALAVYTGIVNYGSATVATLTINGASGGSGAYLVTATTPVTWANLDQLDVYFSGPITEWAGSGTVNVVQNDAEYAYNSATADSSDTSSFAYGPTGTVFGSFSTANRSKRVRFLTPIQANDSIILEVKDGAMSNDNWIPVGSSRFAALSNTTGITIASVASSVTDMDVNFGSAGYGATPSSTAQAWSAIAGSSLFKWRVRKSAGGQAVGFSEYLPGVSAGLVGASGSKGFTDGSSGTAGYVGEYKEVVSTGNKALTTATVQDVDSTPTGLTLTPGTWDISGHCILTTGVTTKLLNCTSWIGDTTGTSTSGRDVQRNYSTMAFDSATGANGGANVSMIIPTWRVNISVPTTYYLKTGNTFTTSTLTANGIIRATRIR
jgi:hypothetical protein